MLCLLHAPVVIRPSTGGVVDSERAEPAADEPLSSHETDGRWRRPLRDALRGLAALAILHVFVLQISVVRGHSMQPSLHDGDRLMVDRVSHHVSGVNRFSVVVLSYPRDPKVDFVKRVVGLPGDRVRLDDGRLYVNGRVLEQSFASVADSAVMTERVVPNGCYFVLGDNRPISCDSRDFGMVASDLVKGTVRARFWPLDRVAVFD